MKRLVIAIVIVLSLAVGMNAQTFRGAINGTVVDPSGAAVPNAAVKAMESATGLTTLQQQLVTEPFPFRTFHWGCTKSP